MTNAEDQRTDKEIGDFQNAIREMFMDAIGKDGWKIDGGGCDSGDWMDFTLAEVRQGIQMLVCQRDKTEL